MRTKILITGLVMVLLLAACSTPAATPTQPENPSILAVSGSGNASDVPDVVDIQLGVETVSEEPGEAVSENTSRMNAVMETLSGLGIPSGDVQTVYYSMWIEDIVDENYQPTGVRRYHVTNQINIRSRDLTITGTLIEKAIKAGATTIAGVNFGIEEQTQLEQTAMDDAIADARQKAERIATEMGVTLGQVKSVNFSGTYPPVPYYGEKGIGGGVASAVPISEGQFSLTVQVQVSYEIIP